MEPAEFDACLQQGWRLLGSSVIRHNFAICRSRICRTIPLRIRLDQDFTFAKSQRRILRRNTGLNVRLAPIDLTPEKEALFNLHTTRFRDRQTLTLHSFLHPLAHSIPVSGLEYSVFDGSRLVACSYFHIGKSAMSGTYCFFDPGYDRLSLGSLTMLLELELAQRMGKQFYYHGYCYDVPSQFDYKLNFNQLEALDWKSGAWKPHPRVPVRMWSTLV